jgi:acetyl esterase/lipase
MGQGGPVLPPERPGHAAPADILASRRALTAAVTAGHWQTELPPAEQNLGGVRVLRFRPVSVPRATVIHFHGGGYRIGAPEMLGPFAVRLAQRCGVELICPAYRLAPEYPFPSGLVDARAVLDEAVVESARPIIISGDSAGGGLAAALAMLASVEVQDIAALLLFSAWLDLTVSAASYAGNADSDLLFSRGSAQSAAALYLQGHSPQDPLASPSFAPSEKFPPTFISVGEGEVLLDDSRDFHRRLLSVGIPAELSVVAGMEHTAVIRGSSLPGAAETFEAAAGFIDRILTA